MKYIKLIILLLCMVSCTGNSCMVIERGRPISMAIVKDEAQVVHTAVELFARDYHAVFGDTLQMVSSTDATSQIVVATCGVGEADSLMAVLGIERDTLIAYPQSYYIGVRCVDENPCLYVIGGDAHGTA